MLQRRGAVLGGYPMRLYRAICSALPATCSAGHACDAHEHINYASHTRNNERDTCDGECLRDDVDVSEHRGVECCIAHSADSGDDARKHKVRDYEQHRAN